MTTGSDHWQLPIRHALEQVLGFLQVVADEDKRLLLVRATERERISEGVQHALDILHREGGQG
jgi:hypothetical protein